MRQRVTALLLVLGLPLLALGIATPASAQVAPELAISSATLVARGAGADFTVTATCEAGATAYVHLAVTERSGNRIAKGFGSTDSFTCTGEPQTITVLVVAQVEGAPLRVGDALVNGALEVYDEYGQTFTTVDQTVRITA